MSTDPNSPVQESGTSRFGLWQKRSERSESEKAQTLRLSGLHAAVGGNTDPGALHSDGGEELERMLNDVLSNDSEDHFGRQLDALALFQAGDAETVCDPDEGVYTVAAKTDQRLPSLDAHSPNTSYAAPGGNSFNQGYPSFGLQEAAPCVGAGVDDAPAGPWGGPAFPPQPSPSPAPLQQAQQGSQIFVSLPDVAVTEQDLVRTFSRYGPIEGITILRSEGGPHFTENGTGKGAAAQQPSAALLQFANAADAQLAQADVQCGVLQIHTGFQQAPQPQQQARQQHGQQHRPRKQGGSTGGQGTIVRPGLAPSSSSSSSKTLYLNNIPAHANENYLRQEFTAYGPVEYVRLLSQSDR